MRILIDIGHPAHVHYFRNFIKIMESKAHVFFVSARDRSIIPYLLNKYSIPYFNRGKGSNSVIGKLAYMVITVFRLYFKSRKFKPDIYISFASPYTAQVSFLRRKPHIVLDDTEHARFGHFFYKPFSDVFINPSCFKKDFGKKQILINSYTELFYLHPKHFCPDPEILNNLGIKENEKFTILRFISWNANHDIGQYGLSLSTKTKLLALLLEYGHRVFISSEEDNIQSPFSDYIIKIPPEKIHHAMFHASLLITEGATMASECAAIGTPAIYVNSLDAGTLREQEDQYHLIYGFRNDEGVIDKVKELLKDSGLSKDGKLKSKKMVSEKIDFTAFLVWFIENYPKSSEIMSQNPDFQNQFR